MGDGARPVPVAAEVRITVARANGWSVSSRILYVRSFSSTRSHLFATSVNARPCIHHAVHDLLVLDREAFGRVDHQHDDVGPLDRLGGPHEAEVLDAPHLHLTSHPGRVDEPHGSAGPLDHGVDGVARRAGLLEDDRALLPHQAVEQARLPDVRATDQREPRLLLRARRPARAARRAGAATIRSSRSPVARPCRLDTGERLAEPQTVERGRVGLLPVGVHLVRDQQDRHGRPAEPAGERGVLLGDPGCGVDHQQDQVGLGDRAFGLPAGERLDTPRLVRDSRPCRRARSAGRARPPRPRRDRGSRPACRARSPRGGRRAGSRGSTSRRSAARSRRRAAGRCRSRRQLRRLAGDDLRARPPGCSSMSRPLVSITIASSGRLERVHLRVALVAALEGAADLVARASRAARARRSIRFAGSATRYSLTGASGKTTVAMSRPSITAPPEPERPLRLRASGPGPGDGRRPATRAPRRRSPRGRGSAANPRPRAPPVRPRRD